MNGSFVLLGLIILFWRARPYAVPVRRAPHGRSCASRPDRSRHYHSRSVPGECEQHIPPTRRVSLRPRQPCHGRVRYCVVVGRKRKALAAYSIVSGVAGLIATALFITDYHFGLGMGGMERVAAYPLPLWLTVFGISLVREVSVLSPN